MSLKENEIALERELIGKGKTAPRVTSDHVDACIVGATYSRIPNSLGTLCVMALYNGHVLYGVNTGPVSAENFDPAIGERLAFENAREQIWPLEGYLLRDRLHRAEGGAPVPAYGSTKIDPVEAMAAGTAMELLRSKGYAYDVNRGQWLRGDEDLVPGPAPTDAADALAYGLASVQGTGAEGDHRTDAARYLSQGLGEPVIVGADYGTGPAQQASSGHITSEGVSVHHIEQIDGSADIVRDLDQTPPPVAADGYATSEGANVHGIGPHTDGGDNPDFADAGQPADPEAPHGRHPDGTPITVVTDEQQAAITAADTTEATEGGQVATGPSEPQG